MNTIRHHISQPLLAAYASGALPHPFALVVAAHVSMCDDCRARLEAEQAAGGVVLEALECADLSGGLKASVLTLLDDDPAPARAEPRAIGPYPAPVIEALGGQPPRWRALGLGTRQRIIHASDAGTVRLLHIPAGQAVPDHGHNGLEMTLVLQGSFSDDCGTFGVGDVEIADQDLEHTPVAGKGMPCICLAATDAPLKFNSLLPRMLQPILRI
ncbi:ChrR family anti-sigma-E factor [Actibacterium sp. XHP0104]|uniref:ChrR family anti-sigma-E factor n=1 Tax=Actibacterium sp. XHP0104 TaxID=2984335 RepID=UPI0021E741DE|nr:ChrR family anti-sigma-E factor [Actibacterium sp. XHP0104]MCV2882772.1 ChrR family anti-sigma-E factor [Actibacterium sp. XHP0104]